jgi:hypothetical protein
MFKNEKEMKRRTNRAFIIVPPEVMSRTHKSSYLVLPDKPPNTYIFWPTTLAVERRRKMRLQST